MSRPWRRWHLGMYSKAGLSCCAAAGTMLFGESTPAAEAHQLLDVCFESGINFFDTAEMYPVPQRAETAGQSEVVLGQWMKQHARYGLPNRMHALLHVHQDCCTSCSLRVIRR